MELLFLAKLDLVEKARYITFPCGYVYSIPIRKKNNVEVMNFIIDKVTKQHVTFEELDEYFDTYKYKNDKEKFVKDFSKTIRLNGEHKTMYVNYKPSSKSITLYFKSSNIPYFRFCSII